MGRVFFFVILCFFFLVVDKSTLHPSDGGLSYLASIFF